MARSEKSDPKWDFIKQVLPNKSRAIKRVDDQRVINCIGRIVSLSALIG